jgi:DNA-binding transcriptional regulator YdaS (Cro superfamily)
MSPSDFAKQLGVAEVTLRSLENGARAITPERAKEIEERTKGALTRAQLRPDIFEVAA